MNYVQSFINNISFPTNLEGLESFYELFDLEKIIGLDYYAYNRRCAEWTSPRWAKKGDIVFFMHSKTANSRISALRTELISKKEYLDNDYFWRMMNSLSRAKQLHKVYGGKIFAIGRISDKPLYDDGMATKEYNHFKGRIFAPIDSIFLLHNPIDISEFNDFINISRQSAITPVFGERFDKLKSIVLKRNSVVELYFENSKADPVPLKDINETNWIRIANKYRRSFFLEEQFREYYVNWFLRDLGDKKTFFRECTCFKGDKPKTFIDNIIIFQHKFLPVEVKLSVSFEKDIISQLQQYCNLDKVKLNKNKTIESDLYDNNVLVIDTEMIYLFNNITKELSTIFQLDKLNSKEDIDLLKESLVTNLI